ncbi:MAG: hypothetical protein IPN04_00005 [Rhodoferax sp.]|nr:hypothetical protein [Rhodoferax sp.]
MLYWGSSSPALSVCVGDQIQAHIEGIDTVQFTLVQESQHKTQALTSSTARVLSTPPHRAPAWSMEALYTVHKPTIQT